VRLVYFSAIAGNRVRPATKSLLVRYIMQEKRHEKNPDMGRRPIGEHDAYGSFFRAIANP
jgi:hypothetical protein